MLWHMLTEYAAKGFAAIRHRPLWDIFQATTQPSDLGIQLYKAQALGR